MLQVLYSDQLVEGEIQLLDLPQSYYRQILLYSVMAEIYRLYLLQIPLIQMFVVHKQYLLNVVIVQ